VRFASLVDMPFPIGEGVVGRACASRTPVWVRDLATEPACSRNTIAAGLGIHAGLVVPVVSDGQVIAVIEFFMTEQSEPDARFVKLVSAAAAQLASVMARKTAESSLVERVRVAALGSDVGIALMKRGPIEDILRGCAEAIVWNLDAALARIWTLRRPAKDVLELRASAGLYTAIDGDQACIPVGKLEIGRVAEHRNLHVTNDVLNDPWIADPGWAKQHGLTAFAGFPLIVADDLVGVIAIFARHALSGSAIDGLSSIADAIALGVQHKLVEQANTALEAQLLHAQKMEAVGRLAGGIAHDFNNLLSVILSYSEWMVEELKPGEPMREYSEEICKAGHRAAGLTRQLLMFSRQQVVEPKVLDLNDVLAGMAKMLPRILGADIEQVSVLADRLGRVCIDLGSIEQVVMNLVVNARDAMPTGGKLTVETANIVLDDDYARAHVGVKSGPHVMLTITDTGQGMDAATQSRIFEPFFTTKPSGKGTGLGLSTVFGIVHQSGGSVWVESEVGHGTTVRVMLPQVNAPLDVEPALETVRTSLRGSETILVVDDDEQVRVVACGILRRYGYKVIEAASPGDAMLMCERVGAIDVLLSDVVMPQMSGPALAKRLASSRPDMKLLCMSGYTDDSIIRHGVYEGDIAFVQKPFTSDTLTKKVRDLLDQPAAPPQHA
jgi:signal transduction histidine kinase/CheY-like chemotaxis protein